jgi:hypothetical protein
MRQTNSGVYVLGLVSVTDYPMILMGFLSLLTHCIKFQIMMSYNYFLSSLWIMFSHHSTPNNLSSWHGVVKLHINRSAYLCFGLSKFSFSKTCFHLSVTITKHSTDIHNIPISHTLYTFHAKNALRHIYVPLCYWDSQEQRMVLLF